MMFSDSVSVLSSTQIAGYDDMEQMNHQSTKQCVALTHCFQVLELEGAGEALT